MTNFGIDYQILSEIKRYNAIVIYGAGKYASLLNDWLLENGICVDCFVVTDKNNNMNNPMILKERDVYELDDYAKIIREKNILVIIGTIVYEQEIELLLHEQEIFSVIKLSSYLKYTSVVDFYKDKSEKEYIYETERWYKYTQEENRDASLDIQDNRIRDEKSVLFLIHNISPRVVKMAKALHNRGFQLEFYIFPGAINYNNCFLEVKKIGQTYIECKCVEEILFYAMRSTAKIIHLFVWPNELEIPYIMMKRKKLFPPIIYDSYDIFSEMYSNTPLIQLELERKCLELAEGICNRGYEIEYLIKEKKYNIQAKSIHFLDYCNDSAIGHKRNDSNDLSLCFVGTFLTEKYNPGAPAACMLEFAKLCAKNRVHLHIYPVSWSEAAFEEYLMYSNDYFHFHHPVDFNQLKDEISKFDYGIYPMKDAWKCVEVNGYLKREKFIYGVINKVYDYLEAGLPAIITGFTKFVDEFKEDDFILNWAIEEYDFEILKKRKTELKNNALRARNKYLIDNHIEKIIEFYNKF